MRPGNYSVPADDIPDPMLLVSPEGEVMAANRAAREDFGIISGPAAVRLSDLVADAPGKVGEFVRLCSSTRDAVPGSLSFRTPAGPLDCRCDGRRTADGSVSLRCRPKETSNQPFTVLNEKISELAHEIAVRMRTEEKLQDLLRSRDLLIQELHHRIGNSLQVAISLAGLQMREATDGSSREQILKLSHRLKAIGLVYRTLYRDQDFSRLDITAFVNDLCAELRKAYRQTQAVVSIRNDATLLNLDQAVPFSLIVNELVTNALVHAFRPGHCGSIEVTLHRLPRGLIELKVADDGIGIPSALLKAGESGTGLILVRALTKQLDGTMQVDRFPGTTFRIAFPETWPAA
jgi:two-component sensor histidine kinase